MSCVLTVMMPWAARARMCGTRRSRVFDTPPILLAQCTQRHQKFRRNPAAPRLDSYPLNVSSWLFKGEILPSQRRASSCAKVNICAALESAPFTRISGERSSDTSTSRPSASDFLINLAHFSNCMHCCFTLWVEFGKVFGIKTMDQAEFQDWLSVADRLTAAQRAKAARALSTEADEERSVAAVERGVGESRICPRCGEGGAVRKGKASGLWRYLCKSCGRTFNAVTGTPLQGLHKKERWLSFGESLAANRTGRARLSGRHWTRRRRRRSRTRSARPGRPMTCWSPTRRVAAPPCARVLGVSHIALNQSAGPRIRNPYHIQTVGNRQSHFKGFLFHFRGVATKYLGNDLQWYQLACLYENASPSTCLGAAVNSACIRIAK